MENKSPSAEAEACPYWRALMLFAFWLSDFTRDFKTLPNILRSKKILAIFLVFAINSSFAIFWPIQCEKSHVVPVLVIQLYFEKDLQLMHDTSLHVHKCHIRNCTAHLPAKSFSLNTAMTCIFFCKNRNYRRRPDCRFTEFKSNIPIGFSTYQFSSLLTSRRIVAV